LPIISPSQEGPFFYLPNHMMRITKTDLISVASTAGLLAVAGIIFNGTSNEAAKAWDIQKGFWFMLFVLLTMVGLFVWNARELWARLIAKRPSTPALAIVGACVLAFALFITINIHKQHRVLSDENSWTAMALQMYYNHSGGVCNQGYWTNGNLTCTDEVNNFKGKSLGTLEYVFFHIMPSNRDTALALNFPLYLLSLILFFFALYRFIGEEWIALAATVFLGAMPIYMLQAQAASTEVLYIFLLNALLLIYALVPPDQVRWKHIALIIAVLGFFSGTRQETVFCFIPFALYYQSFLRAKPWHLPLFTGLVILASWPAINTMAAYRGYDFQGGTHAAHAFENLRFNLQSNIGIMMRPDMDGDILKNPFYTAFTVLWLFGTGWLLVKMISTRKYLWGGILLALFHLQSFVILYNVSGTFEIDINQRYVLVALPTFAFLMAFGLYDFLNTVPATQNPLRRFAIPLTVAIAIGLSLFLTVSHTKDFQRNMLYYHNKLLTEEDFLNTELRKLPPNSIFIYSRPWQMLCSGFNAFSENTILGWTDQEYAKWREFSQGNIYLVRGQDGFGDVDKNSRVVGFKTTEPIQRLMTEYATETILTNSKDFGYPLTIIHIKNRKGRSPFAEGFILDAPESQMLPGKPFAFSVHRTFPDSLPMRWQLDGQPRDSMALRNATTAFSIAANSLPAGIHTISLQVFAPNDDTVKVEQDFFVQSNNATLIQALKSLRESQEWSTPHSGKSVEGNALRVKGRAYAFGIGSHANSSITYRLDGRFQKLHTHVGLDDESACGDGAQWFIRGDQKELWKSPTLTAMMVDSTTVNVSGVQVLELEINRLQNNFCDHADWVNTWLE